MKRGLAAALLAVFAAGLAVSPALAGEAIATADAQGAPPAAAARPAAPIDPNSPQAIGDWARGVLAGSPAQGATDAKTGAAGRCPAVADRKPHGEMWAGIGTRGYRNLGGVVTQPLGDCGGVTLAVERAEGRF